MSTEDLKKASSGGHEVGMGLALTTIFIAGQMAGGGVLMLPGTCPSPYNAHAQSIN